MTSGPAMAEVSYSVVFAALWAAGPVRVDGETVVPGEIQKQRVHLRRRQTHLLHVVE
jgi:hypothetical protein